MTSAENFTQSAKFKYTCTLALDSYIWIYQLTASCPTNELWETVYTHIRPQQAVRVYIVSFSIIIL